MLQTTSEVAMTQDDETVPRAVRELWGTAREGSRGPKKALSVRAIAAAGVALADAEGLEGASMAAVAKRLGFTTMSLYRYVDSRAELETAMVDEALGTPPQLNRRHGWRRQLTAWADAEAARLTAHPWVLDVRHPSPPLGPHTLAWMDLGLQILEKAGLSSERAASTLLFVDGYVRQQVLLGQQYADGGAGWADRLRLLLVDPDSMPALSRALAAGVFDDDPSDFPADEFRFGLDLILDGVEKIAGT
jgi:AcrR family transcriptional regulator